ncbi:GFA family protein [Rhodopila sp.]|uniref:GFA family protein n=1 Tax=Rhodopila sp. TaxID=2480087 RepID=UPI003D0F37E4
MELPLTGGCLCGAIRYQITQKPPDVYTCHCTDCQRMTSSAFSLAMLVPTETFHQTGKEAVALPGGVTGKGRAKSRWVCPDCGVWLYSGPKLGAEPPGYHRNVRGGTLDDPSWLRPTTHYWTRSAQPWALPTDGMIYETQPD